MSRSEGWVVVAESKKVTETEVTSLTERVSRGNQGLIACQVDVGDAQTRVDDVLGAGDDDEEGSCWTSVMVVEKDTGNVTKVTVVTGVMAGPEFIFSRHVQQREQQIPPLLKTIK